MWRNVEELLDCVVEGTDGAIGRVHDLYVDDHDWAIRFLVVEAGAGLDATVSLDLSREAVRYAPAYDPGAPPDRAQSMRS